MKNKKSLIALFLLVLIGLVAGAFAYFTSSVTLKNEFSTHTYSAIITEKFTSPDKWTPGTTTEKIVNVTNTGNVEVAVRATYTEKWVAADGTTILEGIRNNEKVALFDVGSDWIKGTDGYYYYNKTLAKDQTTSNFIESVTFNSNFVLVDGVDIKCTSTGTSSGCESLNTGYAGAKYTLKITVETIQADQKWNYTAA